MEGLLNFAQPLDLNLLEQVVASVYQGSDPATVRITRARGSRYARALIISPSPRAADQLVPAHSLAAAGAYLG